MGKSLIISVHDFSPKFYSELEEILSELDALGFHKRSLLVVPNYGVSNPIGKHSKSIHRLINEKLNGNEICMHGYDHSMKGLKREFKDLDYNTAMDRIWHGVSDLRRQGLGPVGFVPPFWKISKEAERAVKMHNFEFLVKKYEIKDLKSNEVYFSNALMFFYPGGGLNYALYSFVTLVNKFTNAGSNTELVRVELHPQDIYNEKHFVKIMGLVDYWSSDRRLISHREYLASKRLS